MATLTKGETSAIREGVKEFFRMIILAIVPVLVVQLEADTFEWKPTVLALTIAVLRALDKWLHENPNVEVRGISPL